jgi:hypothetical protein
MPKLFILAFLFICSTNLLVAQFEDPNRFNAEVALLKEKYQEFESTSNTLVFTGSSSIRKWISLGEDLNHPYIINTGFGGSHMSDLAFFIDDLVVNFQPSQVFIYEGDNDLEWGVPSELVLEKAKEVVRVIQRKNPNTQIFFLAAKPSPRRWELKEVYEKFNEQLLHYTASIDGVYFIDTWSPLLNKKNVPEPSYYVEDSLHLSEEGYRVWTQIISRYIQP